MWSCNLIIYVHTHAHMHIYHFIMYKYSLQYNVSEKIWFHFFNKT